MWSFTVEPSTIKNKKLKVIIYKDNKKVKTLNIGDSRYYDYIQYYKIDKDLANQRKRLYLQRHSKEKKDIMTASWWSDKLLWSYPSLKEAVANIDLNR